MQLRLPNSAPARKHFSASLALQTKKTNQQFDSFAQEADSLLRNALAAVAMQESLLVPRLCVFRILSHGVLQPLERLFARDYFLVVQSGQLAQRVRAVTVLGELPQLLGRFLGALFAPDALLEASRQQPLARAVAMN
jgi:hypothetical protein